MTAEEDMGFTLIDARNAFNEINRTAMLWTARHIWPSGSLFAFNIYRHHSTLTVRGENRTTSRILSQEGVTQGCPLAMILYALALVPMIKELKSRLPNLQNTWYADDGAARGRWTDILKWY